MTITVATAKLVDLLADGLETASGGIHLATHRAPYKDEPGDRDLLAATSSTGYVLGHTWIPVDGNLTATVWPPGSARNALALLRNLAKKGDNHTVDIGLTLADPPENLKEGEHPGWTVTLTESAALFSSDTELQFHAYHESKFRIASAARQLAGLVPATDDDYVDSPLTLWPAGVMGPLVKVARRNGGTIRLYRSQEHGLQVVQIGPTWLGAAVPSTRLPGEPTDSPDVDPVLGPELSTGEDLLRNGYGLVTTTGKADGGDDADQHRIDDDELLRQAVELVVTTQFASPAQLQRKLKIGLARAKQLLVDMEAACVVGPQVGSAQRDVLFKPDQVAEAQQAAFGDPDDAEAAAVTNPEFSDTPPTE